MKLPQQWTGGETDTIRDGYERGDRAEVIAVHILAAFGVLRTAQAVKSRASVMKIRRNTVARLLSGLVDPAVAFAGVRFKDDPRAVEADRHGPQPSRPASGSWRSSIT